MRPKKSADFRPAPVVVTMCAIFTARAAVAALAVGASLILSTPSVSQQFAGLYGPGQIGAVYYDDRRGMCSFPELGPGQYRFNTRTQQAYVLASEPMAAYQRHAATDIDETDRHTLQPVPAGLHAALQRLCDEERQEHLNAVTLDRQSDFDFMVEQIVLDLRPPRPLASVLAERAQDTPPPNEAVQPLRPEAAVEARVSSITAPEPVDLPDRPITETPDSGASHSAGRLLERGLQSVRLNTPTLRAAQIRLDAARQAVVTRTLEEDALTVSVSIDGGLEDPDADDPFIRGNVSPGISVTLPIYDGGRALIRTRLQRHETAQRELDIEEVHSELASSARVTFWNWAVSVAELMEIREWRAPLNSWHERAQILLGERLVTDRDTIALEAVLIGLDQRIHALETEIEGLELAWAALTDISLDRELISPDSVWTGINPDVQAEELDRRIEDTVAMRRTSIAIDQSVDRLTQVRLEASGRLDFAGRADIDAYGSRDMFVGLEFELPLYDSGVSQSRETELSLLISAAMADRTALRGEIREDIQRFLRELRISVTAIEAQQASFAASRRNIADQIRLFEELPGQLSSVTNGINRHLGEIRQLSNAVRDHFVKYDRLLHALDILGVDPQS